MNGKQLKNSILQWAIQGKLVPQDPNDEPASVLLEKIRAEKARLVKDGKLKKKDLEVKPILEDEIPFEIPKGWEWCRINDVCIITNGFTPLRTEPLFWDNGTINWFTVEDIREQGEIIHFTKQKITEAATTKDRIVRAGSVLLCCTASVGQCALTKIPVTTNQQFNALTVKPEYNKVLSDEYLFLFSKTLEDELHRLAGKTTFEFISVKKVGNIAMPLPPLAEQQRIVAKIEELMPLVEKYGAAQEALDEWNQALPEKLKKSILQEAIQGRLVPQDPSDEPASVLLEHIRKEKQQLVKEGKLKKKDLEVKPIEEDEVPFEIPESWEWCRIDDYTNRVTDFVASGSFATLRENVKYYKEENYALLVKTKDFQNNFTNDLTYTDEKGYKFLENSNLYGGELILSNVGSIGKVFVVPNLDRKMTLAPNAIMVRFWKEEHRDWLFYLFNSSFGESLLFRISSATAIRKFNKTDFKKLVIPLPPLAEQRRIVAKIEELFGVISKM